MNETELSHVGSELVLASKAQERKPGEILHELFPYVYEASRRMSSREISRWLLEKHGIQVSQPTISRALRNARAFWGGFAETIEPVARRVCSSLDLSMRELLLDDSPNACVHLHEAFKQAKEQLHEDEAKEVEQGLEFLSEKWFALSVGTRRACAPLLEEFEFNDPHRQEGE